MKCGTSSVLACVASSGPKKSRWQSVAGLLVMAVANLFFASMIVIVKKLFTETSVSLFEVVYFRGLGMLFFNMAYARSIGLHILTIPRDVAAQLFWRIVVGIFAMSTYLLSNKLLPISLSAALGATDPIFTALLGWLAFKEKITRFDILALLLAFVGVLCIVLNPLRTSVPTQTINPFYMFVPILSAVACAIVYNVTRQLALAVHFSIAPTFFGLGLAITLPGAALLYDGLGPHLTNYSPKLVAMLFAMSILGWMGQLLMSKALQIEIAGRVTVMNYAQIAVLFLLDAIFFGVSFNFLDVIGTALIIGCNFTIGFLKLLDIIT